MMDLGTDLVLVTGADGWLGRNLIKFLILGDRDCMESYVPSQKLIVRTLVLPGTDTKYLKAFGSRIQIVEGDISNIGDCRMFLKCAQSAVVLHAAGVVHPKTVGGFFLNNVAGTRNLLRAAVKSKVRRFVAVSSNSPCGTNPYRGHVFDEASPYRPYLNYGKSKMMMELVINEYSSADSIETVIIRPPWFYGPYQPKRQVKFFKMIRDGVFPIIGSGNNQRSMGYLSNVCQGVILGATEENAPGNTYWIADEKNYTLNEIVDTVERLMRDEFDVKCSERRLKLPNWTGDIAYLTDWMFQKFGIYQQGIHVLSEINKDIVCSIQKAKDELGYRPRISLVEGMRRSLKAVAETL